MTAVRQTVVEAIAETAAARSAACAFVFPGGGSNLELIEALERHGIRIVLTRSEGGAALMAAAYADLVGRPGLVVVGLGPGTTNVVNGLAHARLDQSAVVVISDRFTDAELERTGHQVLDQRAVLAPVTKWQATVTPQTVADVVERAFSIAANAPRGPVHLELARDVALAPVATEAWAATGAPATPIGSEPRIDRGLVAASARAIAAARRPVVLVGDEALSVPQPTLMGLVDRLQRLAFCSYKAKGAVPEEHDLWCGIVTNSAIEAALLDRADVILAIGLDPVELLPQPWHARAPVIAIREHDEPAPGYRPKHLLLGEPTTLVADLDAALGGELACDWTRSEIDQARGEMLAAVRVPSHDSLSALEVIEHVQAEVPASQR